MSMHYADYKKFDMLNGEGVRNSLFTSGCSHACVGCFSVPAWNYRFGNPYTKEIEDMIINDLNIENINVQGLSLLGGDPFEYPKEITELLIRVENECDNKDVWCWSGYTFEQIIEDEDK